MTNERSTVRLVGAYVVKKMQSIEPVWTSR